MRAIDFALEPSARVAGQRVYRYLTRRASGLEQRVEVQRTEIRVLERTIHQPVAVRVGDIGDVVPDGIRLSHDEGLTLVPYDQSEQIRELGAIHEEVVHAPLADDAVLFGEKHFRRDVPDELSEVDELGDRTPKH